MPDHTLASLGIHIRSAAAELTARMWSLPPLRHALPIWLEALSLANERRSCK
jgi:hypothetical protein